MNVDGQNVIIKRSVTVGKVLVAVLLVTLGFAACIWLANRIEGKVISIDFGFEILAIWAGWVGTQHLLD